MLFKKLSELAKIDISNVDKKSKQDEQEVKLCNFVDVYHKWALKDSMVDELMSATANDNQISRFQLHSGQVAITKDSETKDDIGMAMLVDINTPDVVLGYHCALITPDGNELSASYLNVVLHSSYAGKYFEMNASGSGQRYTLTNDIIGNFPVPIIPLKEQEAVSDVFDQINNKILTNNAIISELEVLAKDIYDYWFVQFDFPDENGKPYKSSGGKMVWNEELKREIPKGWKCVSIDKCCEIVDCLHSQKPDYVYENKNYFLLQTENLVKNGLIDLSNPYYVSLKSYKDWTSKIEVREGDLLITNAGRVGCVYRISKNIVGGIGRNMTAIRPLSIPSVFFYYYMIGHDVQKQIKGNTDNGAFFSSFNVRSIKKLNILLPNETILTKAENILSSIRTSVENAHQENSELTSLRDFLLPLLMNGQVKVGTTEA